MRQSIDLAILVVLAEEPQHAYGIYRKIMHSNWSLIVVRDWAIYRELPRLVDHGFIEVVSTEAKPVKYRLTSGGRRWLRTQRNIFRELERVLTERL